LCRELSVAATTGGGGVKRLERVRTRHQVGGTGSGRSTWSWEEVDLGLKVNRGKPLVEIHLGPTDVLSSGEAKIKGVHFGENTSGKATRGAHDVSVVSQRFLWKG